MASVLEHRAATKRDQSSDSKKAKAKRQRMMVMPMDELSERLKHLRNLWWYEGNQVQINQKMNFTCGPEMGSVVVPAVG
jgi:hypothetical protein